jgi:hypothetical protein
MTRQDDLLKVSALAIFTGFVEHYPACEKEAACLEQNPAYGTARTLNLQDIRRLIPTYPSPLAPDLALPLSKRIDGREDEDADKFNKALGSVAGRRVIYTELTGKTASG